MVHLELLRVPEQQMEMVLKVLRLSELHMSINTRPPNKHHRRLALDALMLQILICDSRRQVHKPRDRDRGPALGLEAMLGECRDTIEVTGGWCVVEVEGQHFGHRRREYGAEFAGRLEVDMYNQQVTFKNAQELLAEWPICVGGTKIIMVLLFVPVCGVILFENMM